MYVDHFRVITVGFRKIQFDFGVGLITSRVILGFDLSQIK